MSTPKISVVVPAWNEEKYIHSCLAALKKQTFTDFEAIFVDRHSTDDTPRLVKSAGWEIFNQKQPGISAARAEGFARARGEIIASTDADSAPSPQWLETIARVFSEPDVVCAYGPTYFFETDPFFRSMGYLNQVFLKISRALGSDQIYGMNFAVRKSAYKQIGGYNTSLPTAEDVDLGYRIRKAGRVVYHPQMLVLSSSRRLRAQKLEFFTHHVENFIRLKFFGTASSDFKPIR